MFLLDEIFIFKYNVLVIICMLYLCQILCHSLVLNSADWEAVQAAEKQFKAINFRYIEFDKIL